MPANCSTCPFRHIKTSHGAVATRELLQCRRTSPTPDPIGRHAMWPTVSAEDVCAEHPDFEAAPPPPAAPAQAALPL